MPTAAAAAVAATAVLAAFLVRPTVAALSSCADTFTPTIGHPAAAPVGVTSSPSLLLQYVTSYDKDFAFIAATSPPVGPSSNDSFTRKLSLVVGPRSAGTYAAAAALVPTACKRQFDRWDYSGSPALPADTFVTAAGFPSLEVPTSGDSATCRFLQQLKISWGNWAHDDFDMNACGFALTPRAEVYEGKDTSLWEGRVYVAYDDYDSMAASSPVSTGTAQWNVAVLDNTLFRCEDFRLPTLGDDATPGYIPAGPILRSPGDDGYLYVIDSSTDALTFYFTSYPGIGPVHGDDTIGSFTRTMDIVLSSPDVVNFEAAYALQALYDGCRATVPRFAFPDVPGTVLITKTGNISGEAASSSSTSCYVHTRLSVPWEDMRSYYRTCGFVQSRNDTTMANGTYIQYKGRVHVRWWDYDSMSAADPVRTNMSTWYDVVVRIQAAANDTTNSTANPESPYDANFQVTSVTYEKSESGQVQAHIAYQASTKFPYYAKLPFSEPNANNFLFNDGSDTYAGNDLTDTTVYPNGVFTNEFSVSGGAQDGYHTAQGLPCNTVGQTCSVSGILTYTWDPRPANPLSCTISSDQNYQFRFKLDCNSTYNGTTNYGCGETDMRDAIGSPDFGAFRFTGNIDFCKSAQTDFPITWTTAFDVLDTSRDIGQTIEANGVFTTNKQLDAVAIKEYRVSRGDLEQYWSLWTKADDIASVGQPANPAAVEGGRTAVGEKVNFVKAISSESDGTKWTIRTSFTPNIKLYSTEQASFGTTSARGEYMISLPNDRNLPLSFTITVLVRMYADTTMSFTEGTVGRRRGRRLLYRDFEVQEIDRAPAVHDAELVTRPVKIRVPENVQVSTDGTVTVLNVSSQTLSPGAIAGIAVVGTALAAALVAAGVLLGRRSRRRSSQIKADAEAAGASADEILAAAKIPKTHSAHIVA